ncbi:MAG: hypothetical protein HYV63_16240 [Candidatus Schekmanbacteria bacterium]|nr:hypothetical protein [Candidatus Schekmanbacteria bacterium]
MKRATFSRPVTASAFVAAALMVTAPAPPAAAGDYCKAFMHADQRGELKLMSLAAPDSDGIDTWRSTSVRRLANELDGNLGSNMNDQVSSIRIRAMDTDVYLYAFTDTNFRGELRVFPSTLAKNDRGVPAKSRPDGAWQLGGYGREQVGLWWLDP